MARTTTTDWESDFVFDVFDRAIVELLQSEPRNIRHCASVLRGATDASLREWAIRCGREPDKVASDGVGP